MEFSSMVHIDRSLSAGLHPSHNEVSESKYKEILQKVLECLKKSIRDVYAPQKVEGLLHGWRFNAWRYQVDLQLSPQWKKPNLEDMYDYIQLHPGRKIL